VSELAEKDYIVIVQCHIVKQRCSGYFCEKAFHDRVGGFAAYSGARAYRTLYMSCGGCCGLAVHRKLNDLARQIKKNEDMDKDRIAVQLASCVTRDNYHGPPCPHLDYIKTLISRLGLDVHEDTRLSELSQRRRKEGLYS
jgi:predicted metal-binding protein